MITYTERAKLQTRTRPHFYNSRSWDQAGSDSLSLKSPLPCRPLRVPFIVLLPLLLGPVCPLHVLSTPHHVIQPSQTDEFSKRAKLNALSIKCIKTLQKTWSPLKTKTKRLDKSQFFFFFWQPKAEIKAEHIGGKEKGPGLDAWLQGRFLLQGRNVKVLGVLSRRRGEALFHGCAMSFCKRAGKSGSLFPGLCFRASIPCGN